MYLTLEIIGADAARFGSQRKHTFDVEGGRIGRAPDNEWVIPDQYIHSVHAVVRFMSGLFFIEKRGQNRVAVNRPEADLSPNEPFPLKDGDKLFIDEYEMSVQVSRTAPKPEPVVAPSVSLESLDPVTGPRRAESSGHSALDSLDLSDLDPLRNLHSIAPAPRTAPEQPLSEVLSHGSVLSDFYRPPGLSGAAPAGGGGGVLPDDWDKTSFSRSGASPQPAAPAPPPQRPSAPPPAAAPIRPPAWSPPPPSAPPYAPAAPPPAGSAGIAEALGLRPGELTAADLPLVGRALRNCLAGLIQLLQMRSEIRSRLRLGLAGPGRAEANPLKAAANLEDGLDELFRRRRPGALPVDQAVTDAVEEAQVHQLAMLDAMRGAFDALIARLDPSAQVENFEAMHKRGALGLSGRSRYWDNYLEYFRTQLGSDRDEAFRRLFGADFAAAYDQALERRRTQARHRPGR